MVSARTGAGFDELLAAIERDLPSLLQEVDVLVPYSRGDLVSRLHEQGDVLESRHEAEGTRVRARVHANLAADLADLVAPA